jgi:hypothetical protein
VYVYATTVPVDSSKMVKSITFPNVSNTTRGGVRPALDLSTTYRPSMEAIRTRWVSFVPE